MFGKSRNNELKNIARRLNGEFHKGTFFKSSFVKYNYKVWEIFLDDYIVQAGNVPIQYTRLRTPFINDKNLNMKIYKKNIFSKIGESLGLQDILIGDFTFDENWIVKGNDEALIKNILRAGTIRQLIMQEEKLRIEINKVEGKENKIYRDTESQLTFLVQEKINDETRLMNLKRLFELILDRFIDLDITNDVKPQTKY